MTKAGYVSHPRDKAVVITMESVLLAVHYRARKLRSEGSAAKRMVPVFVAKSDHVATIPWRRNLQLVWSDTLSMCTAKVGCCC